MDLGVRPNQLCRESPKGDIFFDNFPGVWDTILGVLEMVKNRVRYYRKAAGLTIKELAARAGLSVSTIGDIELGAEPRVVTAVLIARALGVTVEQLWPIR